MTLYRTMYSAIAATYSLFLYTYTTQTEQEKSVKKFKKSIAHQFTNEMYENCTHNIATFRGM